MAAWPALSLASHAEPAAFAVGLIDTAALPGVSTGRDGAYNATIETRSFIPDGATPARAVQKNRRTHAQETIASVSQSARAISRERMAIFLATPFYEAGGTMAIDWSGATTALTWLRSNNVRYVCTNFVTVDSPQLQSFLAEADRLGLTIVASLGNGDSAQPYPAMDPRTIAVGDSSTDSRVLTTPHLLARADALHHGGAASRTPSRRATIGSSFATARVCGQLAASNGRQPMLRRQMAPSPAARAESVRQHQHVSHASREVGSSRLN